MNLIFMGTPEFAVPALEMLHQHFGIKAVVTIPDKPIGRGQKLMPSAVKITAQNLGIDIFQPSSLRNEKFREELAALKPDIICVIAFRILPASIFSLSCLGSFNVHASLLPKYRGAAPIQHAIINGEAETGVTSFLLNEKVDAGNIILQKKISIPDGMTAGELYRTLMPLAANAAVETCFILQKTFQPLKQNDEIATPAPKIFRDECAIDWSQSAHKVRNFIHGVSPIPCAWTLLDGKRLKIYRCALLNEPRNSNAFPGEYEATGEVFRVMCGDEALDLLEIQPEGKPIMTASAFIRGRQHGLRGKLGA